MGKSCSWKSYSASHSGNVRPSNQDHIFSSDDNALWCVADGMGGHANGKKAAIAVCDSVASAACKNKPMLGDQLSSISDSLNSANRQYWRDSRSRQETSGAAFVALAGSGPLWLCLWAGDSRVYSWHNGTLEQLTHDHRPGTSSAISKAFGITAALPSDVNIGLTESSQRFLLCTDGLTDAVNDQEIVQILKQKKDLKPTTERLIAAALAAGGRDNISISLCEYS